MEVIETIIESSLKDSVVLTFGTFDGIHLGHQAVIKKLVNKAKELELLSAVLSFYPHPLYYISPQKCPSILTSKKKKLELLESMGVDIVVLAKLKDYISEMSPEEFVKEVLRDNLLAKYIIVGYDCTFGKNRAGNAQKLQKLGTTYGIPVEVVPPKKYKDVIISSTLIRQSIAEGNIKLAKNLLGRYYSISGKVIKGEGLGKKIGYPTANIDFKDQVLPPNGIYAVEVKVEGEAFDGVLSIGFRPTFEGDKLQVETYLFDFQRDIYGEYLEIYPIQKLREQIKFPDQISLKEQIEKDVEHAKNILSALKNCGF